MSIRLFIFSIIYSFLTFYFINADKNAVHGSGLIILLPLIWIIGFILLFVLYRYDKKIVRGKLNKILLVICSPIPVIVFFFGAHICETQKTENIYRKNGYIVKESIFIFQDRTEYRSNNDSKSGELLIDSVRYYNKETKRFKVDIYEGWERFLLSEGK